MKVYIRQWKTFTCLGVYFYTENVAKHQINIFRRELSEKPLHDYESGHCRDSHSSWGRCTDTCSLITFKLGIDKKKSYYYVESE